MRSIQVETTTGSITVTDPHQLKSTVDTACQKRASGGYDPFTWYAGHPLDSATAEGKALRISIAEQGITGTDLRGIPEHIRYLLEDGQYKYVPKLGTRAHTALYLDRSCMTPRTTTQWREYWAARSKGTAPGQSQLSVNLVWSLQLRVDHDCSRGPTPTDLDNQPKRSKPHKTCITLHVFDLLGTLSNLVLVTALVPTSMLRNVMCLLDKVAGSHSLPNKRHIGLVEQMAQATLSPQFRILEVTWEEHAMLDKFQSGGCKCTKL